MVVVWTETKVEGVDHWTMLIGGLVQEPREFSSCAQVKERVSIPGRKRNEQIDGRGIIHGVHGVLR